MKRAEVAWGRDIVKTLGEQLLYLFGLLPHLLLPVPFTLVAASHFCLVNSLQG
jgi:hypothetical protein